MKSDFNERGRVYFPGVNFNNFNNEAKKIIDESGLKVFSAIQLKDAANLVAQTVKNK